MRAIISKEEQEKKKRRNQFIVGGVLIVVMLFSTLGYALGGQDEEDTNTGTTKISYNGFQFIRQNDFWLVDVGNLKFVFKYNPKETSDIGSKVDVLSKYSGQPLYISSENQEAEYEIYRNFDQVILRRQYACLDGEKCDENYPLKTCDDNFIIIKESEIMNISQDRNCVFIQGPQDNLTAITDEFLFKTISIK